MYIYILWTQGIECFDSIDNLISKQKRFDQNFESEFIYFFMTLAMFLLTLPMIQKGLANVPSAQIQVQRCLTWWRQTGSIGPSLPLAYLQNPFYAKLKPQKLQKDCHQNWFTIKEQMLRIFIDWGGEKQILSCWFSVQYWVFNCTCYVKKVSLWSNFD